MFCFLISSEAKLENVDLEAEIWLDVDLRSYAAKSDSSLKARRV